MRQQRHIAVDFDGVLYDHVPWVLRAFRDHLGIDLGAEGMRHWDYFQYRAVERSGVSVGAVKRILQVLETDPFAHQAGLRDRRAAAVMQGWIDAGHRVDIVTARDPSSEAVTRQFLERNKVPFHELRMGARIKTGYDLLVDDAPHNVLMAAAGGGQALLLDHPYNRDVPCNGNPTRVKDWGDVQAWTAAHSVRPRPVAPA